MQGTENYITCWYFKVLISFSIQDLVSYINYYGLKSDRKWGFDPILIFFESTAVQWGGSLFCANICMKEAAHCSPGI